MKSISGIIKILSAEIQKALWALGLHAFSFIIFFVIIDLIFGGFIFYNYVFLAERTQPKVVETILKFNDKTYQSVLDELQTREQDGSGSLIILQTGSDGQQPK